MWRFIDRLLRLQYYHSSFSPSVLEYQTVVWDPLEASAKSTSFLWSDWSLMLFSHFECLSNCPHREASEREKFVLLARVVLSTTDTRKLDSRTANHDAAIDIEGAENLMSSHLQRQAAPFVHETEAVDDTEKNLKNVQTQRSHNRDELAVRSNRYWIYWSAVKAKRENELIATEAKPRMLCWGWSEKKVHVEGVIRQIIRKAFLMLSENINDLAFDEINIYMKTLFRFVRALVVLQNMK